MSTDQITATHDDDILHSRVLKLSLMKTFLLISLLMLVPSVRAQQVGLIANTDGRKTISLDG